MKYTQKQLEVIWKGKDRGSEDEQPITIDLDFLVVLYELIPRPEKRISLDQLLNKVYQMDSLEYLSLFPDESVDLVFSDEPYGQNGNVFFYNTKNGKKAKNPIVRNFGWDQKRPAHLIMPWLWEVERILKPGGALVNCGLASWGTTFQNICRWSGLTLRAHIPWLKTNPMRQLHPGSWRSGHEMIWVASKGTLKERMKGKIKQEERINYHIETVCPNCGEVHNHINKSNYKILYEDYSELGGLLELPSHLSPFRDGHSRCHDTQKPSWMSQFYTDLLTKEGDIVVDPFCGSGELLLESAKTGRGWGANDISHENKVKAELRLTSTERSMFNYEFNEYLPKVQSRDRAPEQRQEMSFLQGDAGED